MSKEYDFYKCKYEFEKNKVSLPEDINSLVIDALKNIKCDAMIPHVHDIQAKGLYGQFKVANKNISSVIYTFKYQCGMIITWDVAVSIEKDNCIAEKTITHKNKLLKIEKRKKENGRIQDNADD